MMDFFYIPQLLQAKFKRKVSVRNRCFKNIGATKDRILKHYIPLLFFGIIIILLVILMNC